jgi:guanosine-3',5'-bis(diphosphate) 3'-pyrophosphohydrolase
LQFNMEREPQKKDCLEKLVENSPLLSKAYKIAQEAHQGKFRADGTTPYFSHCVAVAKIICEEWKIVDEEIISATLLHDTEEDTDITLDKLASEFGPKVAFLVDGVSKLRYEDDGINTKSKEEKDRETVRKVFSKNLIDPAVGVLKLADRLHNMRTLSVMPLKNQIAKADETKGYAKLAESLGMWEVMRELENLSMKYSNHEDFDKYSRILAEDPRTQEDFVSWLSSTLEIIAGDASIDANVETRTISLSKLKNKKGKYLTENINDLISFRIVIPSKGSVEARNNVYKMLGALRQNFADVEDADRFDDFYSKPRDNDYSAIQLTLDFPQGSTEIAITSEEKEEFNKWGVVSLIRKGDLELAKHALKLVFTLTHEVKFFPSKATGLDFAYSISSEMGARADNVLINGVRFPISTVLPNGAEVEIELGKPRIVPKKEVRDFSLPTTKSVIHEQISEEAKWRLEIKGKETVENIISRRGLIDLTDLLKIDKYKANLEDLLFILGCKNSVNDLYYKIGSGVMDPKDLEKHFDEAEITKKHMGLTSILIEGSDNPGLLNFFASEVENFGGNIRTNYGESDKITFTQHLIIENLTAECEAKLATAFRKDPRITKVIVV